jgi:hypothetical protein
MCRADARLTGGFGSEADLHVAIDLRAPEVGPAWVLVCTFGRGIDAFAQALLSDGLWSFIKPSAPI